MKKIICFIVLMINSSMFAAAFEEKKIALEKPFALNVSNLSGTVEVIGVVGNEVNIKSDKIKFSEKCHLDIKNVDGKVSVEVTKDFFGFTTSCEVNFAISIPETMSVVVDNGSGTVSVKQIKNTLVVDTGSGDIFVKNISAQIESKTGSGDVTIEDAIGNILIRTGSGDVKTKYLSLPSDGSFDVKTGSGDVDLSLPVDSKVHIAFSAGSGDLESEFGSLPEAKFKISVATGSGDLRVIRNK